MLPLKLTVHQVKPDHTQLDVLVNGVHYAPILPNQFKYICVDMQKDSISLQAQHLDGTVEVWQIDSQTIFDAAMEPQELAIRPNDQLVIRFRLAAVKYKNRSVPGGEVEISNENTFEAPESSLYKNSSKEEPSLAIMIQEKNSLLEPSSTIDPSTFEYKPIEHPHLTCSTDIPRLDELAQ